MTAADKAENLLATRYDKTTASYRAFIHVVSLRLWSKHFVDKI